MIKKLIGSILVMTILLTACGEDTPEKQEYKDGVIVVNQGAFLSGTGTLTYKERGSSTLFQNIYSSSNEGAVLGNVAQSMIDFEDKAFIAINNGGKVVVTNKDDMTLLDTISNINQARYFASNGDKLYLSAWGDTGSNGGVYEIDVESNTIKNFIDLGNGPEGMAIVNNRLYVANSGGFGLGSTLHIIDITDNSIVENLTIGDNPELIVADNDDNIYVICNGFSDFFEPTNNTAGQLVKINGQDIEWSIEIPNGSNKLAIDASNDFIYFSANGTVLKHDLSSEVLKTEVVQNKSAYALGFDKEDELLYIADAKDFASQGEVFIYSTDNIAIDSFSTGIIPGYIHFR